MNNYSLDSILAHTRPMILLDDIDFYDDTRCICRVIITTASAFYNTDQTGVASYIGSEYMAQTIAAYAGANALDNQESIQIGFLLGSRSYKTTQEFFKLGQLIFIEVEELYREESGLSVFGCVIKNEQKQVLAEAKVNVFQPEDAKKFLEGSYE